MLFDAHAHLDLLDENLDEVIAQAGKCGVAKIISCSTSFSSNQKNLELAKAHGEIRAALGLYPLDAIEISEEELERAFEFFEKELTAGNAAAIGEVGLDYKYCTKKEPQERQQRIFERFIELSKKYDRPIIVHSRFAQSQALEPLIRAGAEKVIMHSFTDSEKLMKKAAEKGFFISVGVNLLQNQEVQKRIIDFPLEKLLFETDSPLRFNGEKVFPEKIAEVSKKVAELKKVSLEQVGEAQEKAFNTLF